jgi:hypothetical protein
MLTSRLLECQLDTYQSNLRAFILEDSNSIKNLNIAKKTYQNTSQQPPHSAESLKLMNSSSPNSRSNYSSLNELNIYFFSLSLLILCLSLYFVQKITVLNEIRKSQATIKTGASNHKIKNTHTQKQKQTK